MPCGRRRKRPNTKADSKTPGIRPAFQSVEKVSQSLLPAGSKDNPIMFSGGVYGGEHTSQAASVGSVRQGRTDPARSGLLSSLVGKGFAFFDKRNRRASARRFRLVQP